MNGTYIGTTTEVKGIEIRNKKGQKKSPYPMKSRERMFMFYYSNIGAILMLVTTGRILRPPCLSSLQSCPPPCKNP